MSHQFPAVAYVLGLYVVDKQFQPYTRPDVLDGLLPQDVLTLRNDFPEDEMTWTPGCSRRTSLYLFKDIQCRVGQNSIGHHLFTYEICLIPESNFVKRIGYEICRYYTYEDSLCHELPPTKSIIT